MNKVKIISKGGVFDTKPENPAKKHHNTI
jgi:hypothetical protein